MREEVTRRRRELSLLLHPDKNHSLASEANQAFLTMRNVCDLLLQKYLYLYEKKKDSFSSSFTDEKSTRYEKSTTSGSRRRKRGEEEGTREDQKEEFPSHKFTRSEFKSKRQFIHPTDEEFADLVRDIDTRANMWRSFVNPESSSSVPLQPQSSQPQPPQSKEYISNTHKLETETENDEKFACLLCRRRFFSSDHLSRHVQSSKLHASRMSEQT
jgi:hypothetical protein